MLYLLDTRPLAGREREALALLSAPRRESAVRCKAQESRLGTVAGGLLLRQVLGITDESALTKNQWGKPALPGGPCFSLSHSGHYAALAVAEENLGVDIEPVDRPFRRLSRQLFQEREFQWLAEEPTAERFYTLWTRLEALAKADGRGLLIEGRTQCLLDTEGPWYLRTLTHDGHMISLAAAHPPELAVQVVQPELP